MAAFGTAVHNVLQGRRRISLQNATWLRHFLFETKRILKVNNLLKYFFQVLQRPNETENKNVNKIALTFYTNKRNLVNLKTQFSNNFGLSEAMHTCMIKTVHASVSGFSSLKHSFGFIS